MLGEQAGEVGDNGDFLSGLLDLNRGYNQQTYIIVILEGIS